MALEAVAPARTCAWILTGLAVLFLLRVLGQAMVAFLDVPWLPPKAEWYSGLLPYPALLPAQIVILAIQARISLDLFRGRGFFAARRPRAGRVLLGFSTVYFAAMLVRYGLTMAWYPERRWLGTGTIPIVFHWVLATYLFVLARFHRRPRSDSRASGTGITGRCSPTPWAEARVPDGFRRLAGYRTILRWAPAARGPSSMPSLAVTNDL